MVDVRGFVFDTVSNENPRNVEPAFSGYTYQATESSNFKKGKFSTRISGLKPQSTYFYRACAHNEAGWSYGEEVNFTTKKAGLWYKITSSICLEEVEIGIPSGVKVKFKIR